MRFVPYHHHTLRARANDGVWRACRTQLSAFGANMHIFDAKNEICIWNYLLDPKSGNRAYSCMHKCKLTFEAPCIQILSSFSFIMGLRCVVIFLPPGYVCMHAYRMCRLPLALTNVRHTYMCAESNIWIRCEAYIPLPLVCSVSLPRAQCLSLVLSVTRNFFLANSSRKC